MADLTILRAKPNPIGKDRFGNYAPNPQLNAEWIDVKNTSGKNLVMTGVKICDHTFNNVCGDSGKRVIYVSGYWVMPAGSVLRIHSGKKPVFDSQMSYEDRNGADLHVYTGNSYVWNNVCGDIAEVLNAQNLTIDKTAYGSRPVEGKILVRSGQHLV